MASLTHKRIDIPPKPDWWESNIPGDQIITVHWNNQSIGWWNEVCADVMEVFGLPGKRFYYKPYPDVMTFTFKTKRDADLCKILISEKV